MTDSENEPGAPGPTPPTPPPAPTPPAPTPPEPPPTGAGAPYAPPAAAGPFAPVPRPHRVPWVNPTRRLAAGLIAAAVMLACFGAGIGAGWGIFGSGTPGPAHVRPGPWPRDGFRVPGPYTRMGPGHGPNQPGGRRSATLAPRTPAPSPSTSS